MKTTKVFGIDGSGNTAENLASKKYQPCFVKIANDLPGMLIRLSEYSSAEELAMSRRQVNPYDKPGKTKAAILFSPLKAINIPAPKG